MYAGAVIRVLLSPPCLLVETRWGIPRGFDGFAPGPLILLRPGADAALLAHEKVHVRQFWRSFGLMPLCYLLSSRWRLRYELEAYREQIRHAGPDAVPACAQALAHGYRLGITMQQALGLLMAPGPAERKARS